MNETVVQSLLDTAAIHEKRLLYALNHLAPTLPIAAEKVRSLNDQEILIVELLISRFSKLQGFLGSKLIDVVVERINEFSRELTMIDKINKLEKFHLIKEAKLWKEMRELRNHLSHEYPNHPELLAKYLNQTYKLSFELIDFFNNLRDKIFSGATVKNGF
ncbi:MAG: hypothetical protein K0R76_548 [Alphaproteobacteria bacterium]|jgi:hypothetical protein|nr:hypothetical protein [Alphaproteobacteria bacterium]